jgi:cytochrome c-type biogenesis protein CcmE
MDPARKRRIRLTVALSAAVLLAAALVYTSFSASSEARTPSQLLAAAADSGRTYQLTGRVVQGSIQRDGTTLSFKVRDRNGSAAVPVRYTGQVADTFRDGREVIVTVKRQGDTFVGEKDSLVTKCPSKFTEQKTTKT